MTDINRIFDNSVSLISEDGTEEDGNFLFEQPFILSTANGLLLENFFIWTLRKRFTKAAKKIGALCCQESICLPAIGRWCLLAMTLPHGVDDVEEHVVGEETCRDLETLVTAAREFHAKTLVDTAKNSLLPSFTEALMKYVSTAQRLIIHVHLESFLMSGDTASFLAKLNTYFPADDNSPHVISYRYKFAKLLLSRQKVEQYLRQRWVPNRRSAFEELHTIAWGVAEAFPGTLFDHLHSSKWPLVERLLIRLNTVLGTAVREHFRLHPESTEGNVLRLLQAFDTQTLESQLF